MVEKADIIYGIGVKSILDSLKTEKQKNEFLDKIKKDSPIIYESYESYLKQLDYDINGIELDYDKLSENIGELNNVSYYVPIMLRDCMVKSYYDKLDDDSRDLIVGSYNMFKFIPNKVQFMIEEMAYWLNEHSEWDAKLTK